MKYVQISADVILDLDEIAVAKFIKEKQYVEVVMRGDKQIYAYGGDGGKILWDILSSAAFPAYIEKSDDLPF